MENYTYNFEVRRMVLHFMSAIDGGVVKRYDKDQNVKDEIAVNYLYGPKERIFKDLIDAPEHIKLPIVSVMMTGLTRDNERVKDNIGGRYENMLDYNRETIKHIPMPVPVNLTFEVSIMTKYQMDMEQLLTNFIPYSDPYFIVSWREPFTGHSLDSEVRWLGDVNIEYPKEMSPTDPYSQIVATTNFEFRGYMFKDKAEDVGKICQIDTDYILTNKFFCDYDELVAHTEDSVTESFSMSGVPRVEWVTPTALKTGAVMAECSATTGIVNHEGYDPTELIGRTEEMTIEGWFPNINDIFLSASDPTMFVGGVSSFDIFDGDTTYPEFDGVLVQSYLHPIDDQHKITFDVPILSGGGYLDVIVLNSCGYSKLTDDRRTLESCCENPYNVSNPLHDSWESLQDPFLSGVEVIQTSVECTSGITLLGTIDGKLIKTLGDFFMMEL